MAEGYSGTIVGGKGSDDRSDWRYQKDTGGVNPPAPPTPPPSGHHVAKPSGHHKKGKGGAEGSSDFELMLMELLDRLLGQGESKADAGKAAQAGQGLSATRMTSAVGRPSTRRTYLTPQTPSLAPSLVA